MTALYLAAVVAANLLVARFGPPATVPVALVLIGLDLTCRDRLHDRWAGRGLPLRMGLLIATGGLLSYAASPAAGRVAVASTAAFVVSQTADALAYHLLRRRSWQARANGSNLAGALADSLAFPMLAFGVLLPWIVAGQFAAKAAGGFGWSLLVARRQRAEVLR